MNNLTPEGLMNLGKATDLFLNKVNLLPINQDRNLNFLEKKLSIQLSVSISEKLM